MVWKALVQAQQPRLALISRTHTLGGARKSHAGSMVNTEGKPLFNPQLESNTGHGEPSGWEQLQFIYFLRQGGLQGKWLKHPQCLEPLCPLCGQARFGYSRG